MTGRAAPRSVATGLLVIGLTLSSPGRALAQCTPLLPFFTGVGSVGTINLVYTGSSPVVGQATAMWNNTCGGGIPSFLIRSHPVAGGLNINVNIVNGTPTACTGNQCACTITNTPGGVLTGGTVHVNNSCGTADTVAHELGHLLGLNDTFNPSCVERIMYGSNVPAGLSPAVHPSDCAAVDGLWQIPSESPPTTPTPDGEGEYEPGGDPPDGGGSPILVDLDRNFFRLTGLGDPVLFDIDADGEPEVLSWTAADRLDAFLWLDRNGNGVVDDGAELFGNHTPRIDGSTAANGYVPLAEFDLSAIGGNGNRWIDPGDVIYPELRLWIDLDHDGVSEPAEILSLAEAGVTRIDLRYLTTRLRDRHGNYLRYISRARILVNGHERPTWTTDVFFVVAE